LLFEVIPIGGSNCLTVCDVALIDYYLFISYQVHMIETPTTAPGISDLQAIRQKLRDSLTSALDMVVSKQLVKSVLGVGVGADAIKETGAGQNPLTLEALHPANLLQVSLE
jgi:hypothetical protein